MTPPGPSMQDAPPPGGSASLPDVRLGSQPGTGEPTGTAAVTGQLAATGRPASSDMNLLMTGSAAPNIS